MKCWLLILALLSGLVALAQAGDTIRFNFTVANGDQPQQGFALGANSIVFNANYLDGTCTTGTPSGSIGYYDTVGLTGNLIKTLCQVHTTDPANPYQLVVDSNGVIWGGTSGGGDSTCQCGVLFKLVCSGMSCPTSGTWTLTVLHNFTGTNGDGYGPPLLALDGAGNVYGTLQSGGASGTCVTGGTGCGVVFSYVSGSYSVIYKFPTGALATTPATPNGVLPVGTTTIGGVNYPAHLYGTSQNGGTHPCTAGLSSVGCGTVFSLAPASVGGVVVWSESTIHNFNNNGTDGYAPEGFLYISSGGDLYGTTFAGGNGGTNCTFQGTSITCGVLFKLTTSGTETILHNFSGSGADGFFPKSGVTADSSGNLYGTTLSGGTSNAYGTLFKYSSSGTYSQLYAFQGSSSTVDDGAYPVPWVLPISGTLWGMTVNGGNCGTAGHAGDCGVIFSY